MAEKRKRFPKPKVVGKMVVDGKEIPIIRWLDPEKTRRKWRKMQREEDKALEKVAKREFRSHHRSICSVAVNPH